MAYTESVRDLARMQAEVLQSARQRIVDDIARAVVILKDAASDARKVATHTTAADVAAAKQAVRRKVKRPTQGGAQQDQDHRPRQANRAQGREARRAALSRGDNGPGAGCGSPGWPELPDRLSCRLSAARTTSRAHPAENRHDRSAPQRMTPSEALVETLAANGVTEVFGIVGSAYMDALDISRRRASASFPWPRAGRGAHGGRLCARFRPTWRVHRAERAGITNFVTAIAAAYWAHSPVVFITPETGSMTTGLGGFQETDQLPIFSKITKFQGHVNNPKRMAEIAARCFDRAMLEMGPVQLNIPRDYFYGDIQAAIARRCASAAGPATRQRWTKPRRCSPPRSSR